MTEADGLSEGRWPRIEKEEDEREMVVVEAEFEARVKTWRHTTLGGNAYCGSSTFIVVLWRGP